MMFFAPCRRQLFQRFTRAAVPNDFVQTLSTRPSNLRNRDLSPPSTSTPRRSAKPFTLQSARYNSTSVPASNSASTSSPSSIFTPRFDEEGNDSYLSDANTSAIIARVQQYWPCSPSDLVPPGWSCTWPEWPYLLTYYWLGPYYLMLPQIEMLVNIKHRIPGETRPVLFSTTKNAFIFTLVRDETKLFYADGEKGELWRFEGLNGEDELVRMMSEEGGEAKAMETLKKVEPDEAGQNVLTRILERDEAVIPVLADGFLDYTPTKSMPWEEAGFVGDVQMTEEEEIKLLTTMAKEVEEYAEKHGIAGADDGEEGEDLAEEEEDEDVEPGGLEEEVDNALRNLDRLRDVDMEELERVAAEEDEQDRQNKESQKAK